VTDLLLGIDIGSNAANGTALPGILKSRTVDHAPEAFVVSSISE
jgi:hypothetical protein